MPRPIRAAMSVLIFLLLGAEGIAQETHRATLQVQGCESITNARPGYGAAYKGTLRNSDYGLSMEVPPGLTGWGAAPEAPFHGFVIFLTDRPKSCIVFQVYLRVDAGQSKDISDVPAAKPVKVGNRNGWEEKSTGMIDGSKWTNVIVRFSVHHVRSASDIDDGSITLVTPTQDMDKYLPLFQEFVSHIRFEGKELIRAGATDDKS